MTHDSIYYFKRGDFKGFLKVITDRSLPVGQALSTFRELKCLPNKFKQMTVQDISTSSPLMTELYDALRNGMAPESKFKLPYRKEERENQLIRNISESYPIDTGKAECKIVTGHYNDGEQLAFNYALEVVMAPRSDQKVEHAGEVLIIGNINDTPSIDGRERYFDNAHYDWEDTKKGWCSASSLRGILQQCGFNSGSYYTSKKRVPSVCYINLKTPIPVWLDAAGKTHIDMSPYAQEIAKTVSMLAKKMPSYHGKGHAMTYVPYSNRDYNTSIKDYLRNFLEERKKAVEADPSLKVRDRITQSGVWYRIRPKMIKDGYEPEENWETTRSTLTGYINNMCKEEFRIRREDLGIIAAARATMLYKGQSYPVNVDNFKELARKGIAIIVIEKEGIADVLTQYSDKYGIALVHTQGRLTEYGRDLIEEVKESGSIIVTLTDYDRDGVSMAEETRTLTPRIGITKDTVKWLQENGYQITEADVEEAYSPPNAYNIEDEYLKHHRIELDSIVAKVGAEGLWKYIMNQLQLPEFSPEGFDITDVIEWPANEVLYPAPISDLLSFLNELVEDIVNEEQYKITLENESVRELGEIETRNTEVEDRLNKVLEDDDDIQLVSDECEKFLKELKEKLGRPF